MGEESSRGSHPEELRVQMGFTGVVWGAKWGRTDSLRQVPQEHWLLDGEFLLGFPPNPHSTDVRDKSTPIFVPACPSSNRQSCLPDTEGFSGFLSIFPPSQGCCDCWVAIPPLQWAGDSVHQRPPSNAVQEAVYSNTVI